MNTRMNSLSIQNKRAFTLIELLVVVAVVSVLATLLYTGITAAQNKAYTARAVKEFRSFAQAMTVYLLKNDTYPPDVNRDIPAGLEPYLANNGNWPDGPYPGSVYDWDNIGGADPYIQISLRFCDINGNNCRFPIESWAQDFDKNSAMYWCFEGVCRSHSSQPVDHPGYCVNCGLETGL